jgi:hypothetical protein
MDVGTATMVAKLQRGHSEVFKITSKPFAEHMKHWRPLLMYLASFTLSFATSAVPRLAAPSGARSLFQAMYDNNDPLQVQIEIFAAALLLFCIQSSLIMAHSLLRFPIKGFQLKSYEIVRSHTPAIAGFYTGMATAFLSEITPIPGRGAFVYDVSQVDVSAAYELTCFCFAGGQPYSRTIFVARFCECKSCIIPNEGDIHSKVG